MRVQVGAVFKDTQVVREMPAKRTSLNESVLHSDDDDLVGSGDSHRVAGLS